MYAYIYSYTYAVIFFRQIMVPVVEVKYLLNIITYVLVVSWPPDECLVNVGDLGSIPGSGRSPGEGNGNPLQYSCLENPIDGRAWWATVHGVSKSRTRLSNFTLLLVAGILRGRQKWSLLPSLASWDWKACQVCFSGSMSQMSVGSWKQEAFEFYLGVLSSFPTPSLWPHFPFSLLPTFQSNTLEYVSKSYEAGVQTVWYFDVETVLKIYFKTKQHKIS